MTLPFTPIAASVKVAATNASAGVALPSSGVNGEANCLVVNGANGIACVAFGKGGVPTAVYPDSIPIPAGGQRVLSMPNGTTHAAAVTSGVAAGDVIFCVGQGGSL